MRPIPVPVHALVDYPLAIAMMLAPGGFGFARSGSAEDLGIRAVGAALLLLSVLTRYDLGLFPVFSMRAHRNVEVGFAVALLAAAFLGGFSTRGAVVYFTFGVIQLLLSVLTHITRREDLAFRRRHAGL